MGFDDDGFLTADLAAWTTATRKKYGKWFQLTTDVNRDTMKILASIEPSLTKNQELTASLLFRRALQSFQGAVLMAERGMIADALTLVRSCVETVVALGNVVINPKFVDLLIESHFEALVTYSNVLLNDVESRALLTPEQIGNLEKTIADVKRRYPTSNPQRIKWAQAARNAGMSAAYDMIYRMTSGDANISAPCSSVTIVRTVFALPGESGPVFQRNSWQALTRSCRNSNDPHARLSICLRKRERRWGLGITPAVMKRCQRVEPVLVAQVKFTEWTLDDQLRQPVFLGLRTDKEAKDVVRE